MVNNIGIDTLIAIIEELNQHIKEAPDRKGKYYNLFMFFNLNS